MTNIAGWDDVLGNTIVPGTAGQIGSQGVYNQSIGFKADITQAPNSQQIAVRWDASNAAPGSSGYLASPVVLYAKTGLTNKFYTSTQIVRLDDYAQTGATNCALVVDARAMVDHTYTFGANIMVGSTTNGAGSGTMIGTELDVRGNGDWSGRAFGLNVFASQWNPSPSQAFCADTAVRLSCEGSSEWQTGFKAQGTYRSAVIDTTEATINGEHRAIKLGNNQRISFGGPHNPYLYFDQARSRFIFGIDGSEFAFP